MDSFGSGGFSSLGLDNPDDVLAGFDFNFGAPPPQAAKPTPPAKPAPAPAATRGPAGPPQRPSATASPAPAGPLRTSQVRTQTPLNNGGGGGGSGSSSPVIAAKALPPKPVDTSGGMAQLQKPPACDLCRTPHPVEALTQVKTKKLCPGPLLSS